MTRQDILARAFDFRRAWREVSVETDVAASLNHCDALLLSLIVDLEEQTTLHVPDGALANALERALAVLARQGGPIVSKDPPGDSGIELVSFGIALEVAEAGDPASGPVGSTLRIVYGLPRAIPFGRPAGPSGQTLMPLARLSATTWASNLALLLSSPDETRVSALAERLSALMSTEELDPLFLLDSLNGSRRGAARDAAVDLQATSERCRQLERKIRELEVSGLTRQQDLLADAARRRKS